MMEMYRASVQEPAAGVHCALIGVQSFRAELTLEWPNVMGSIVILRDNGSHYRALEVSYVYSYPLGFLLARVCVYIYSLVLYSGRRASEYNLAQTRI